MRPPRRKTCKMPDKVRVAKERIRIQPLDLKLENQVSIRGSLLPALFLFPPKMPSRYNSECRSTACTAPTVASSPSGNEHDLGFEPRLPKFARRQFARRTESSLTVSNSYTLLR